jgi:hypothetical protein
MQHICELLHFCISQGMAQVTCIAVLAALRSMGACIHCVYRLFGFKYMEGSSL